MVFGKRATAFCTCTPSDAPGPVVLTDTPTTTSAAAALDTRTSSRVDSFFFIRNSLGGREAAAAA
jgi:hypothetical protein